MKKQTGTCDFFFDAKTNIVCHIRKVVWNECNQDCRTTGCYNLDLKKRKENGERIDSRNIKKHKNDILRIATEFVMEQIETLPADIHSDIKEFLSMLETEPFEANLLKEYDLSNKEVTARLRQIYNLSIEE